MVKMKSLGSHRYGNRRLIAGDTFEASRGVARTLMALGRAKIDVEAEILPEYAPEKPKRGRPRKIVEDKPAEAAPAVVIEPEPAHVVLEEPSAPSHFYERRDMIAEE